MKKTLLLLLCLLVSSGIFGQKKEGTIYMVSNAHFDSQWNWDVQTSIDTYIRNTLTQNLYLLERYPNYVFNFEGGVKYNWMKEYYPMEYEKVKEYIKSGRWHISGASWDATDPNIPSPESFFRNILLGQQYYKSEFGTKSTDIFLPDCFGFGYTLPTIAAHCGLIGFSTQKLQWRTNAFHPNNSKVPFLIGVWEGVDGSRIAAAADARNYTAKYSNGDVSLDKEVIDIVSKSPNKKGVRYYGTGDVGGSPTIASVEAVEEGIVGKGPVNVVSATSDQLFKEYLPLSEHPELPVYKGELLMDVHATGCYTSQGAMKLYNRRNEQLADAAERASVVAEWLGGAKYPQGKLNEAWKRFVWHQFHDDLTGTSIPKAYAFSWNDELISQSQFNDILTFASSEVARNMDTRVKGEAVVVFNSLGQRRKEIVYASVKMPVKPSGVDVYSAKGEKVNAQLLSWDKGVAQVAFAADMEPVSYSVYDVRKGTSRASKSVKIGDNWVENSVYRVTLDKNGDIASIVDKRNGKELVASGKAMRLALFAENESYQWPAWEVLKKTVDGVPVPITENVKISIAEAGSVRATLKVERSYNDSKFVQYVSLTQGGADDRIDVKTDIDWRQTNALLKVEFPTAIDNPNATYDLGIGSVERGVNTKTAYEVYAQQWADITAKDKSYGVAISNDCKYGWDKPDNNTIRLTLLHTPKTDKRYMYQDRQDIGKHTVTYSIIGHNDDYVKSGIVRKAEAQNVPVYAYSSDKHAGSMGKSFSMLKVSSEDIDVKAFKRAENEDAYIVRVHETAGKDAKDVEIEFAAPIEHAMEVNGIEENIRPAVVRGNKLIVSTTAFKPKTYSVKLAPVVSEMKPLKSEMLDLKFNAQGYTSDAFREQAKFDADGNSYSFDLLPSSLMVEGVEFKFGKMGYNNIIKCDGDTIALPANNDYKTLYLLVASTDSDKKADFIVGANSYSRYIPYYSGFFGQWGWDKNEGYIKDATLAYIGSHRHNFKSGNEPYVFTYMYKIALPVDAQTKTVILPKDKSIAVFAAALSQYSDDMFTPVAEYRSVP